MLLNKGISISYFIATIKFDLLAIILYATTIGVLDNYSMFRDTSIPLGLTSVIGTAVSLLLAFRTSQSYERWWEARIIWGAIVNDSRTLIRQVKTFYMGPDKDAFVKDFGMRQVYWCQSLVTALRKQPLNDQVKQYVESQSVKSTHIPNALLSLHSDKIAEAFAHQHLTEFQQVQLDNSIMNLCNSMGRCERIKNTVFPRSYRSIF
jgi:ion channel-forming bestrophin family protein